MLGRRIADPGGMEGPPGEAAGLGLLDIETTLTGDKVLRSASERLAEDDAPFEGFEMHVGRTQGEGARRPFLYFASGIADGAASADGRIAGCHVHGLFAHPQPRAALLVRLGAPSNGLDQSAVVDAALEDLARGLERSLDIASLARIAGIA